MPHATNRVVAESHANPPRPCSVEEARQWYVSGACEASLWSQADRAGRLPGPVGSSTDERQAARLRKEFNCTLRQIYNTYGRMLRSPASIRALPAYKPPHNIRPPGYWKTGNADRVVAGTLVCQFGRPGSCRDANKSAFTEAAAVSILHYTPGQLFGVYGVTLRHDKELVSVAVPGEAIGSKEMHVMLLRPDAMWRYELLKPKPINDEWVCKELIVIVECMGGHHRYGGVPHWGGMKASLKQAWHDIARHMVHGAALEERGEGGALIEVWVDFEVLLAAETCMGRPISHVIAAIIETFMVDPDAQPGIYYVGTKVQAARYRLQQGCLF